MNDPTPPVVEPPAPDKVATSSEVWGVVLAAGTSSRFGDRNKLLQGVDGQPMVRRVVEALLDSELAGLVVVVGYEAPAVRRALGELNAAVVENDAYHAGQSTSVRQGVAFVTERDADAVLVALGDMPSVSEKTVDALLGAYERGAGTALAAAYEGERGNPVLFDSKHFDALTSVTGDTGGRHILQESAEAALVETGDPGVRRDVDTPDDLAKYDDA